MEKPNEAPDFEIPNKWKQRKATMKYFLSTLLKIILRIHSPSLGRVPRFRDLNNSNVNKEIAIRAYQGLQEGMSQVEPLIIEEKNEIMNNEFDPKNMFCFVFHDFCNNCEHMEVRVSTAVLTGINTKEVVRELTCERFDTCKLISEKISKDLNDDQSKGGDTQ
nr:hypothetical protein [uncultured Ruminococcus sp.]